MTAGLHLRARDLRRSLSDGRRRFDVVVQRLSLAAGDTKAIVGPSGCGKTTALEMLAFAAAPLRGGDLTLSRDRRSEDVAALWERGDTDRIGRLRSRHFGYVLQTANLFPFLSVAENVALPQQLIGRRDDGRVRQLLRRLDVDLPSARPTDLSVGQRQRVAIARALAHCPTFVLADEPTGSLDPTNARLAMALICEEARSFGAAVLVVTHDHALVDDVGLEVIDHHMEDLDGGVISVFHDTSFRAR